VAVVGGFERHASRGRSRFGVLGYRIENTTAGTWLDGHSPFSIFRMGIPSLCQGLLILYNTGIHLVSSAGRVCGYSTRQSDNRQPKTDAHTYHAAEAMLTFSNIASEIIRQHSIRRTRHIYALKG
jgi:hypothetical protein